jgi:regulator of protease activity HflC (stomatin/prohibitin superfamily)
VLVLAFLLAAAAAIKIAQEYERGGSVRFGRLICA